MVADNIDENNNNNVDKIKLLSRIYLSNNGTQKGSVTGVQHHDTTTANGPPSSIRKKIKKNFVKTSTNRTATPGLKLRIKKMKFDRPAEDNCLLKRKNQQKNEIKNKICICLTNCKYEAIRRVSRQLSYKFVKETELWNICWTDTILGVEFCKDMRRFQKINHFPGMFEICRKDLLARNLNRMAKVFPLDFQIFPKTWCLPADLGEVIAYSKLHRNKTFILKPDQGAQGKGIWITKTPKDIKPTERLICQLYINKPLLIDGFKFDLRVYVLLTSTDPLRIFVYNEGLARFATSKYKEPNGHNTTNVFMHLTNYSVNRHSRTYNLDNECGSKRKFSSINKILEEEGHNIMELWSNIDDIIVKTILSAYPMLKHNYNACFPSHDIIQACFEILGIDILIDHKLKPYILEVNHSPSFHTEEPIDREIKDALLKDAFSMLHISLSDKKRCIDEDKKRVKNRLLQRIKDHSKSLSEHTNSKETTNVNHQNDSPQEKLWEAQIKWEDAHMGGYRRIMPPQRGDPNKYAAFLQMNINQASVYSDTAASKRREECVKQQRKELEARLLNEQLFCSKAKPRCMSEFDEKMKLRRQRKGSASLDGESSNNNINEHDERERIRLMAQRDFLVNNCGILQTVQAQIMQRSSVQYYNAINYLFQILQNFHKYNILTSLDKKKYKDAITRLTTTQEVAPIAKSVLNQSNTVTLGIAVRDEISGLTNNNGSKNAAKINFLPPINFEEPLINCRSSNKPLKREGTGSIMKIQTLNSRGFWS